MRLFILAFTMLLVLANVSFAQGVWDNYPSSNSTPVENPNPVNVQKEPLYYTPTKQKIELISKQWYIGGVKAAPEVAEELIKSNSDAASEWNTSKMFAYPALILAGLGGGAFGYGISSWIQGDSDVGRPFTLGGLGVTGVAFLLIFVSNSYVDSAIEIYNKSIGFDTSLQVKVVPTPQGGVALALAF